MAEPVVKKRETEELKPLIQSANSDQSAKMAETMAKEQETELVKPSHETVKPAQMAEAVANERLKPVDPRITIKVKTQDGKSTFCRIKRDSPLKRLLIAYCKKHSVHYPSAKFLINGDRFNHNKTADDIELEDEAEIDVMVENLGGGEQSFA